ncbi:Proline iminopeptidase [Seminavis robusta]|uniref:Proline iminopeptidase n=1 Tax=Seminavis robusta TaxID=568900 RepID=A0A9N8EAT1_9STRA|nr:Proline iminopeptidase [Seminavis robusta]|eukprot:Sro815_g206440.1 Proline iminopeptidase (368) ;mRNA; r:5058-6161
MYYALGIFAFTSLLYWCYRKFRQAPYKPGMVRDEAAKNDGFDDASLHDTNKTSKDNKWMMPNNVELFFFPPLNASSNHSPILAIHGGPAIAPSQPWKIASDSDLANLYLYHARGCGHSTRIHRKFPSPGMWPGIKIIEQDLGIGAQVGDVERVRRRLGVEKMDLVGHSFGGLLATLYAAEFPEHVRSLTLLVPAAVLELPSKDGDLFSMVKDKLKERGNQEHVQEFEDFMKVYMDFGSLPKETDETLALRQAGFAKHYYRAVDTSNEKEPVDPKLIGGFACYATFLSMGMEHNWIPDLKERFSGTTFPVSIVHGAKDFLPESTSRNYETLFSTKDQVEFYTVEDGDHDLFDFPEVGEIVKKTTGRAI